MIELFPKALFYLFQYDEDFEHEMNCKNRTEHVRSNNVLCICHPFIQLLNSCSPFI